MPRKRLYSALVILGIFGLARLTLSFIDGKFGGAFWFSGPETVQAQTDPDAHGNVHGFAWTDTFGWISLNCINYWSGGSLESRCADAGGQNYGVRLEGGSDCGIYPYNCLRGFAWSPNAGWICFGKDCPGDPPGSARSSYATTYLSSPPALRLVEGFARVMNLISADAGWIDFNDSARGIIVTAGSGPVMSLSGWAWNQNLDRTGLGWVQFSGSPDEPSPPSLPRPLLPSLPPEPCTGSGGAEDCCCQNGKWSIDNTACCINPVSTCPLSDSARCGVCQATDPEVRPWLQTKQGDIYARTLRGAETTPSSATFCVFSESEIIRGFISTRDCERPGSASMQLRYYPTPAGQESIALITGSNLLARLDIHGLINERYGDVERLSGSWMGPADGILDGKVYYSNVDLTIGDSSITTRFLNGRGSGSGLLIVRGDLSIQGNIGYDATPLSGSAPISKLPSFGVIVLGDIIVEPNVTDLVGAYLTAGVFKTGNTHRPLRIDGLVVANKFNLERTCARRDIGSEIITYDGRAVANPPPGMADLVKALPSIRQTVP
ncbi:MAG: hypothetical protein UX98_C0002G0014 [Parcubacteria group bacterium GW2011_GWA2_47_26]|nr:MAG: hypothetical protein UX98_C0002G0014 [Parcubacteria group bacterium GW2011_GWA2_47_26]